MLANRMRENQLAHMSLDEELCGTGMKSFPHRPERATDLLGIIHTDVCGPLRHVSRQGASYFITFTDDYSRYGYVYLLKHKHELTPPYTPQHNGVSERRNGYPKETMGYYFYFPPKNKIVVARYAEFFEKRLISQEISGRAVDLEEIQEEEDTTPSEITSNIPQEVEGFEPPQEEVIPIPAMLDLESNKWIDAMNAEIQSMMDNMVWVLVDLPPGCKTVGSRWLFKKKTDMDGKVCKLQRSIYGLKQASRSWNKRFDEEIKRFGFAQNLDEPCVYQKAGFGEAAFILGIKIYRDRSKRLIRLSQNAYMDKILKRYKMDNSKRGSNMYALLKKSATESEYIAASEAAMEAVWIRKFISGFGIVPTINEPLNMYCDNSAAVHYANEPGYLKFTQITI
ncbi:retrotransposon protein, putative, ty1-copia subclass [Tanacetum coccineum]|uniref:Retrotransposon protein, putative, ty1-copia subclass n=1 Tax=Tanacetum coccineum TaxID=301880 RepID=A0ABQ5GPK4_9ASTR